MSRTYRKSDFTESNTLREYVERAVSRWKYRPYTHRRIRKTKEEYQAEYQKLIEEFPEGNFSIRAYRLQLVPISKEEAVERATKYYTKYRRDGVGSESSRRTAFKEYSKKDIRNRWKKDAQLILNGEEPDHPYPGDYMGKRFIWMVW